MAFYGNFDTDFTIGKEVPKTGRSASVGKIAVFDPPLISSFQHSVSNNSPKQN